MGDGNNWRPEDSIIVEARANMSPSDAVRMTVAEINGDDLLTVPPLSKVIDPDALDTLFQQPENGRIRFTYAGYRVTVEADGRVSVQKENVDQANWHY